MRWISKLKAKLNNVPFFIKEHWPQFYALYPEELLYTRFKVIILNRSSVGDIVDLLVEGKFIYRYEVKRISYAQGDDWGGYSNKQFDLQYHSKRKA